MYGCSDYERDHLLNHVFNKERLDHPLVFVGVSTTNPLDDASGLTEPRHNTGYARIRVSASHWSTAADGKFTNVTDIIFAKAKKSWGIITHFALFDSHGNMLIYGPLEKIKHVDAGEACSFEAGNLDLGL